MRELEIAFQHCVVLVIKGFLSKDLHSVLLHHQLQLGLIEIFPLFDALLDLIPSLASISTQGSAQSRSQLARLCFSIIIHCLEFNELFVNLDEIGFVIVILPAVQWFLHLFVTSVHELYCDWCQTFV